MRVEAVVEAYKIMSQIPSPAAGRILAKSGAQSSTSVTATWSFRNFEVGEQTKFEQYYVVDGQYDIQRSFPVDTTQESFAVYSPSGVKKAVLREIVDNSTKKQFLNIWMHSYLWKSVDLCALDVHGEVYLDGEFGCFEWSPGEDKLIYVAEKKPPKTEPFYKRKAQESKGSGEPEPWESSSKKPLKGKEYVYRQDFGEQLSGKINPAVAVFDINEERVSLVRNIPSRYSPGQLQWTRDGTGIVGVVWDIEPRRLGLVHCTNRESYIFHLNLDGCFTILSNHGMAVRSPRFSPNGKLLVWLEREAGGTHHGALRLMLYSWTSKQKSVLVKIVDDYRVVGANSIFRGIYCLSLPKRCWSRNSEEVFFSTPQDVYVASFGVQVATGNIRALSMANASVTVLDVFENNILCFKSSFQLPPTLILGEIPPFDKEDFHWVTVSERDQSDILKNITFKCLDVICESLCESPCDRFKALLVRPKKPMTIETPLIVCPHGGPHGVSNNVFSAEMAVFIHCGFSVLLVNYRGSAGAGQQCVDFLPGKIGITDVSDVRAAISLAVKEHAFLKPDNVLLFGWSHGGYLVTLLSGKYPEEFKAVVAGNPVTDVAAMYPVTDIPDWTLVETGFPYNPFSDLTTEEFRKMKTISPISYVHQVVAPTLLLIGKKDARVPASQGIQYYHALKTRHANVKLLTYDDNHKLGQVPHEIDFFINTVMWLLEHAASVDRFIEF